MLCVLWYLRIDKPSFQGCIIQIPTPKFIIKTIIAEIDKKPSFPWIYARYTPTIYWNTVRFVKKRIKWVFFPTNLSKNAPVSRLKYWSSPGLRGYFWHIKINPKTSFKRIYSLALIYTARALNVLIIDPPAPWGRFLEEASRTIRELILKPSDCVKYINF